MPYDVLTSNPARPAPRCGRPFLISRAVCLRIASTVKAIKAFNILLGMEDGGPSGTDNLYTRNRQNHWDITSDALPPSSDSGVALDLATVAGSMYPRGSVNKVYFPSGGVRHPPFRSFPVRSFVKQQSSPRVAKQVET